MGSMFITEINRNHIRCTVCTFLASQPLQAPSEISRSGPLGTLCLLSYPWLTIQSLGNLGSQSVNQNGKKEITAIAIHHPSFSLHTPPINYQKDVENPPFDLPSGKRLHNYGKSPCLMGKSTISMAMVNSYVCLPEGTGWGPPVISWFINHCNPQ